MQSVKKKTKKFIIFSSIAMSLGVILLCSLVYFIALPKIANVEKYRPQINSYLKRKFKSPAQLGKLELKTTPGFGLILSTDKFFLKKNIGETNGDNIVSAKEASVEVSMIPLLFKKVIIKKIDVSEFYADVERLQDGSFDIEHVINTNLKPVYKVKFVKSDFKIDSYRINFRDHKVNKKKKLEINGEDFNIRDFSPDRFVRIDTKGRISEGESLKSTFKISFSAKLPLNSSLVLKKELKANGFVYGINLEKLKPYIIEFTGFNPSILKGTGGAKFDFAFNTEIPGVRKFYFNTVMKGLEIIDANRKPVMSSKDRFEFTTNGSFDEKDLFVENFRLESKYSNVFLTGKINNFKNKKLRSLNLRADIDNSKLKDSALIFPKNIKSLKVPLDPFNKILKNGIDATAAGSIMLKGYYKKPDMYGKINYRDFSVAKNSGLNRGNNYQSYGTVGFSGGNIILDSTHYADKKEFIRVTGTINPLKEKTISLKTNSTGNFDIQKGLNVLFAVNDIFPFKLYPVTDMNVKGTGRINLEIKGKFNEVLLNGYLEIPKNSKASKTSLKFKTLYSEAQNLSGKVKFEGDRVVYDEISGTVEGLKVIPSGYSDLKGFSDVRLYIPNLDFEKGLKFVNGSELLKELQVALKDLEEAKGFAEGEIFLKGTEKKLDSKGKFEFKDVFLRYKGYAEPFYNLKGVLRFENEKVYFEEINGNVLNNNADLKGQVDGLTKEIDMIIISKNIRVEDARDFVLKSPVLYKSHPVVREFLSVKGNTAFNLLLKGNSEKDPFKNMVLTNPDFTMTHKMSGFPIRIHGGKIDITQDSIQTGGILASALGSEYTVRGRISNLKENTRINAPIIPDFELKTTKFNAEGIQEIVKSPLVPAQLKKLSAKYSNYKGNAALTFKAEPKSFKGNIDFNNFAASYKPYGIHYKINGGKLSFSHQNIFSSGLRGKISNSEFLVKGLVSKYDTPSPVFDVSANLKLSAKDNDLIGTAFRQKGTAVGNVPIRAELKGSGENWQLNGKALMDKGVSAFYTKQIGLSDDIIKQISINAAGKYDRLDITSLRADLFPKESTIDNSAENIFATGDPSNIVQISGAIDKFISAKPEFENFRISTNSEKSLKATALNPCIKNILNTGNREFFSEGRFKAGITLNGYVYRPLVNGIIAFTDLKIPDYRIKLSSAALSFYNDHAEISFRDFMIDDSAVNIYATLEYPFETPFMVKDVSVTSNYVNVDKIAKVLIANRATVSANGGNGGASGNGHIGTLPFVVKNGKLKTNELIIRDLITSDVSADLSFTRDSLLSVSDIKFNAAKGTGAANFYYNVKTTELSLNLSAENMEANALATTFLNMPNEAYGKLSGSGQFYTKGKNPEEMISDASGYASFRITDGHLLRLGSMEYFLRAANVVQSGIGGFNANNIIDLVIPQKTGYFDYLNGKFDIREGVISAEEITSSGKNLSLLISGNFDMLTNNADVKVLGKLSKKVSGMLGAAGSVSINQFIGYIPGFGFLPSEREEKNLVDLIPVLNKIPIIGFEGKQNYRQFAVDINGNLYDTKSVKSFRWLY